MGFGWKGFPKEIQNILCPGFCKPIEISALTSVFVSLLFYFPKNIACFLFSKKMIVTFSLLIKKDWSWGYSSVVEHLPSMREALVSILNTTKTNKKTKKLSCVIVTISFNSVINKSLLRISSFLN